MALQKNLSYVITGEDKSASSTMSHIGQVGEKLSKTFLSLGAVMAGVFAAERIVDFGKRSVEAFAEEQKAQDALAFSFQKFPALLDTNIEQLTKLNETIQSKTGIDHSQLASAQAVLATFGLTGTQMKQLTPLIADYAAKTGQDAPTAATALGRALLGNTRALKTIGIDFKATGNEVNDFNTIFGLLQNKIGGFAESQGKTFAGQLEILKLSFQDVKEKIGGVFAPALTDLVGIMTDHVLPAFDDLVTMIGPKVKVFLDSAAKGLAGFIDAIAGSVKAGSLNPLKEFFDTASQKIPALAVLETVGNTLAPILPQISAALLEVGKALTQQGVLDAIDKLITSVLPPLVDLLVAIVPLIPPLADALTNILVPAIELVADYLTGNEALFSGNLGQMKEFVKGILQTAGPLGDFFRGIIGEEVGILNGFISAINVASGAITGFINAFSGLTHLHVSLPKLPNVTLGQLLAGKDTGKVAKHAQGGDINRDQFSVVGENGPEIVGLQRGQHVYPAGSGPAVGSGGVTVNLNVSGVVGDQTSVGRYLQSVLIQTFRNGSNSRAEMVAALGL